MRRERFADAADSRRAEAEWRRQAGPRLLEDSPFHQLSRAAEQDPARLAISFIPDAARLAESRNVSFRELRELLHVAANSLHALGARPDGAIAYLVTNTPESLALIWGGTAAGIVAPINHYLEPRLLGSMLARLGAQILVTDADADGVLSWEKVRAAVAVGGCVRKILHLGPAPRISIPDVEVVSWEDARQGLPGTHLVSGRVISGSDLAAYFHTGGTTGMPKFACHTHCGAQARARRRPVRHGVGSCSTCSPACLSFMRAGSWAAGSCRSPMALRSSSPPHSAIGARR